MKGGGGEKKTLRHTSDLVRGREKAQGGARRFSRDTTKTKISPFQRKERAKKKSEKSKQVAEADRIPT